MATTTRRKVHQRLASIKNECQLISEFHKGEINGTGGARCVDHAEMRRLYDNIGYLAKLVDSLIEDGIRGGVDVEFEL